MLKVVVGGSRSFLLWTEWRIGTLLLIWIEDSVYLCGEWTVCASMMSLHLNEEWEFLACIKTGQFVLNGEWAVLCLYGE